MKKIHYYLLAALILFVIGVSVGLYMFYKPTKDFGASKPDFVLSAKQLFTEFDSNETASNAKFVAGDKTVEINGLVMTITHDTDTTTTVVVGDPTDKTGIVNCSLMNTETEKIKNIKEGAEIKIKGQCVGIQGLIEKSVFMIRCVLVE